MTIERDALKADATFTEKARERILVWIKIVAGAPALLAFRPRGMPAGIWKSRWVGLAIVLAANIIAFNYYQERITRYYQSVLLMNIVRMNEELDILQTKIDHLDKKTDEIGDKLDKSIPSSSNLAKPRSR